MRLNTIDKSVTEERDERRETREKKKRRRDTRDERSRAERIRENLDDTHSDGHTADDIIICYLLTRGNIQ